MVFYIHFRASADHSMQVYVLFCVSAFINLYTETDIRKFQQQFQTTHFMSRPNEIEILCTSRCGNAYFYLTPELRFLEMD